MTTNELKPKHDLSFINGIKGDIRKHVTGTIEKPKHSEILDRLLLEIDRVDFKKEANLDDADKITRKHFLIITIDVVLRTAKKNNWQLCKNLEFIYIYNGAYWQVLDKDMLIYFLTRATKKMGIDRFIADHYQFGKELFEQFMSSAFMPTPEKQNEITINLLNGTFEVSKDKHRLREFRASDFITYQLAFEHDPDATCPIFKKYLDRVLPDTDAQKVLAEYIGYVFLTKDVMKLEKVLMLAGPGANGKSVFFEIITALLGCDNVANISMQSLTESEYYRADIANKLVNYASEIGSKIHAEYFKRLASGEPIEGRLPYGKPMNIKNYARLIFNVNELPKDIEHTHAYFRRFILVPFSVTIPEAEQDKELHLKIIRNELPGVLNWVLDGLTRLVAQKGLTKCELIDKQIEKYQRESDSVLMFLEEKNYTKSDDKHVEYQNIYKEYKDYTQESGYKLMSKINFKRRLEWLGYPLEKIAGNVNVFHLQKNDFAF